MKGIDPEQCLIDIVLSGTSPKATQQICDELRPTDFPCDEYGEIVRVSSSLLKQGKSVDMVTLYGLLSDTAKQMALNAAGTTLNVVEHVPEYVSLTKNRARLRGLKSGLLELQREAAQGMGLDELIGMLGKLKADCEAGELNHDDTLPAIAIREYSRMERRANGEDVPVGTGLSQIDDLTGGAAPGEMWIIAARPSVGKSALATQIAMHAVEHGKKALFFSLEMSESMIAQRYFAQGGLEAYKVRTGSLTAEDWDKAAKLVAGSKAWQNLRFDERSRTLEQMRGRARRMQTDNGLDLVVLDYLQITPTSTEKNYGNRNNEVAAISAEIKRMAKDLNIPVIALSQLNRKMGNEPPELQDLRDSGAIEQDADVVIMLHRMERDAESQDVIDIAHENGKKYIRAYIRKNRQGDCGYVDMMFTPQTTRFDHAITKIKEQIT